MPFLPDPRNALSGSSGSGITLAVFPSTTHSSVEFGPIWSFLRTADGTDTWPRFVILVRMLLYLQDLRPVYKSVYDMACACRVYIALYQY